MEETSVWLVELCICEVRLAAEADGMRICWVLIQNESVFHSEVFVIVSLTLFLPICLEQFAR